jgi:hypothetical protein
MDRVLQSAAATISATWYDAGGAVADPGTVTLKVDREDGTNVVAAGAATSGSGAAARTYTLSSANTALLDALVATWHSATLGDLVTQVEVAGGFLFSIADARKLGPLGDSTSYPTADVAAARVLAEQALEDACRVAFVPRHARETHDGSGLCDLLVRHPLPRALRAVSIGDTALTSDELAAIGLEPDGRLYRALGWPIGRRNTVLTYEHGHSYAPARVARACLLLARRWLVESPVDERTTQVVTDRGSTINFLTAESDVFDIPEVNAVVRAYGYAAV